MNVKDIALKAVKVLYKQTRNDSGKDIIELRGNVHYLKTWPQEFEDISSGRKKFEFRFNDRNFEAGDFLMLEEWDPIFSARDKSKVIDGRFTGKKLICFVTHTQVGFGIPEDYIGLSITVISPAV